jgi:hypothetical protein
MIIRILAPVFLLMSCAPVVAAAADFCAFEIVVTDPAGSHPANIPVGMIRRGATSAGPGVMLGETATDRRGIAQLCDAPMEPVDFFVGPICGQVMVKAVRPLWLKTKRISVTYDPDLDQSCHAPMIPTAAACRILLRIRDMSGKAVAGARLGLTTPQSAPDLPLTDNFGRLFYVIPKGEKLQGSVTKDGYLPANVSEDCVRGKVFDRESEIVLRTR